MNQTVCSTGTLILRKMHLVWSFIVEDVGKAHSSIGRPYALGSGRCDFGLAQGAFTSMETGQDTEQKENEEKNDEKRRHMWTGQFCTHIN